MTVNADLLFKQVKKELKGVIPYSDSISNKVKIVKAKSFLGQCKRLGLIDCAKNGFQFEIKLSKYLLECDKQLIKNTIAHELIHTCKGCFNHGYNFKSLMYKINKELGYNVALKNKNKEFSQKFEYKYKLTCSECGKVFYRNRLPKYRGFLRHAYCNGMLQIEQLY